jgi:putative endonuclease
VSSGAPERPSGPDARSHRAGAPAQPPGVPTGGDPPETEPATDAEGASGPSATGDATQRSAAGTRESGHGARGAPGGTQEAPDGAQTGPKRAADRRRALGAEGEDLAAHWYEDNGYEVLDRNWRRREGEIDLIVRRGKTVAFCEVKTRSTDRFGAGTESVLPAKQRRIRRLAARWLSELTPAAGRTRVEVRFDVVGITGGTVEVIENAF